MRVLVLGVTGMLGHAVFRVFSDGDQYEVWGTMRDEGGRRYFADAVQARLLSGVEALDQDSLMDALVRAAPDALINCVGLIKQAPEANNALAALPINALLPHRLAQLCRLANARVIHVSTDCVFSGRKGLYRESDLSDAEDLYGKSKFIGELHDLPHVVTLRTSMIGHELNSTHSLVDWFLSQQGRVKGFAKAIFSGLPTVELARVMRDWVLPRTELQGLYHIAAKPISKLDLLTLIAKEYGKQIEICADNHLVIDRSLNADRFMEATGYVAPEWPELVSLMRQNR